MVQRHGDATVAARRWVVAQQGDRRWLVVQAGGNARRGERKGGVLMLREGEGKGPTAGAGWLAAARGCRWLSQQMNTSIKEERTKGRRKTEGEKEEEEVTGEEGCTRRRRSV